MAVAALSPASTPFALPATTDGDMAAAAELDPTWLQADLAADALAALQDAAWAGCSCSACAGRKTACSSHLSSCAAGHSAAAACWAAAAAQPLASRGEADFDAVACSLAAAALHEAGTLRMRCASFAAPRTAFNLTPAARCVMSVFKLAIPLHAVAP